jgi:hypothetical protein
VEALLNDGSRDKQTVVSLRRQMEELQAEVAAAHTQLHITEARISQVELGSEFDFGSGFGSCRSGFGFHPNISRRSRLRFHPDISRQSMFGFWSRQSGFGFHPNISRRSGFERHAGISRRSRFGFIPDNSCRSGFGFRCINANPVWFQASYMGLGSDCVWVWALVLEKVSMIKFQFVDSGLRLEVFAHFI